MILTREFHILYRPQLPEDAVAMAPYIPKVGSSVVLVDRGVPVPRLIEFFVGQDELRMSFGSLLFAGPQVSRLNTYGFYDSLYELNKRGDTASFYFETIEALEMLVTLADFYN